jgi:hypothetical protein
MTSNQETAVSKLIYQAAVTNTNPASLYMNENWLGVGDEVHNDWNPNLIGIEIGWKHGIYDTDSGLGITSQSYVNSSSEWRGSAGSTGYYGLGMTYGGRLGNIKFFKSTIKSTGWDDLLVSEDLLDIQDTDILYRGKSIKKASLTKTMVLEEPIVGTEIIPIWRTDVDITIIEVFCAVVNVTGTGVSYEIEKGTTIAGGSFPMASDDNVTNSTTGQAGTISGASGSDEVAADNWIVYSGGLDAGATADKVIITIRYTEDV